MDPSGQEIDSPPSQFASARAGQKEPEPSGLRVQDDLDDVQQGWHPLDFVEKYSAEVSVRRASSASKLVPVGRRTCEVDRDVRGAGL